MLKVANLNIFWTNGSYEVPIKHPPASKFTDKPDANRVMITKDSGTVVLKGEYNYAYDDELDSYYFLEKIHTKDIKKDVHKYTMIRDLSHELQKLDDLVIYGELNKTTKEDVIRDNLEQTIPLIDNPGGYGIITKRTRIIQTTPLKDIMETPVIDVPETERLIARSNYLAFKDQLTNLTDTNISGTKERTAIWAHLPWTDIPHGKQKIKNIIETWYKKHADSLNLKLIQIDNPQTGQLMGHYQFTADGDSLGSTQINTDHLAAFALDDLVDITELNLDTLKPKTNCKLKDFEKYEGTRKSMVGYFSREGFKADTKPWENKYVTHDPNVGPYKVDDGGINEKKQLLEMGTTYDTCTPKIGLPFISKESSRTKKSQLQKIEEFMAKHAAYQQDFFDKLEYYDYSSIQNIDPEIQVTEFRAAYYTAAVPLATQAHAKIDRKYWLSEGFPRDEKGVEYDYDVIDTLVKRPHDKFYGGWILDYWYYVVWAGKVAAFHTEKDQLELGKLIQEYHKDTKNIQQPSKLDALEVVRQGYLTKQTGQFLTHSNALLRWRIKKVTALLESKPFNEPKPKVDKHEYKALLAEDNMHCLAIDQVEKGIRLFDLDGTNVYLYLQEGKVSFIFKDIKLATKKILTYKETPELPVETESLYRNINTQIFINAYGTVTQLKQRGTKLSEIKTTFLSTPNEISTYENFVLEYKSPTDTIVELHQIQRKQIAYLGNFNAVEYENLLLNKHRQEENIRVNNRRLEFERQKQSFDMHMQWRQYNHDYINTIVNASIGGLAATRGLMGSFTNMGMQSTLNTAMIGGNYASSTWSAFDNLDIRRQQLWGEDKHISQMRFIENHKLDIEKQRLDEDGRRAVQLMMSTKMVKEVNSRSVGEAAKQYLYGNDISITRREPTAEQQKMIDAHYAHYGVDIRVPQYNLTGSEEKDKTAVGGFKYIENINIKDPVIRTYVMGKFVNGVKLVKPTY